MPMLLILVLCKFLPPLRGYRYVNRANVDDIRVASPMALEWRCGTWETGDGSPTSKGPEAVSQHSGLRGNACFGIQERSRASTLAATRPGSHKPKEKAHATPTFHTWRVPCVVLLQELLIPALHPNSVIIQDISPFGITSFL